MISNAQSLSVHVNVPLSCSRSTKAGFVALDKRRRQTDLFQQLRKRVTSMWKEKKSEPTPGLVTHSGADAPLKMFLMCMLFVCIWSLIGTNWLRTNDQGQEQEASLFFFCFKWAAESSGLFLSVLLWKERFKASQCGSYVFLYNRLVSAHCPHPTYLFRQHLHPDVCEKAPCYVTVVCHSREPLPIELDGAEITLEFSGP